MKVSSRRFVKKRVEKKEEVAKALRNVRIAEAKLRIAKKALKEAELGDATSLEEDLVTRSFERAGANIDHPEFNRLLQDYLKTTEDYGWPVADRERGNIVDSSSTPTSVSDIATDIKYSYPDSIEDDDLYRIYNEVMGYED